MKMSDENNKVSEFLIRIETKMDKIVEDGCDLTKEVEHEFHLAFDRAIHGLFEDGTYMEDFKEAIMFHLDDSAVPENVELPTLSISLLDDSNFKSKLKKAREEGRKKGIAEERKQRHIFAPLMISKRDAIKVIQPKLDLCITHLKSVIVYYGTDKSRKQLDFVLSILEKLKEGDKKNGN